MRVVLKSGNMWVVFFDDDQVMRNAVFALCVHINMHICLRPLFLIAYAIHVQIEHAQIQRGTGGPDSPLKNHKNTGFFSNTCPDPIKITKLSSQHSMLGRHQHASETPFKWRFAGGQMMACF